MFDDKQRLQILIVVAVLAVVALIVTYNAGLSRGQLGVRKELLTAQAELIAQLSATPTVIDTPTETLTPTFTYTPTPSRTPTLTATPTATPASPEEWADRFRVLAEEGLNAISIGELSGDRAESLLRGIAREQGLLYVPATYFELEGVDWAALVVPRTPAGEALPMLFWREPNDRNRIRSQDLLPVLSATGGGTDYSRLLGGVSFGSVRSDFLGKLHVLLVERSDLRPDLRAAVIAQQRPAGDFVPLWDSADDPLWDFVSSGSQLQIMDADGRVLPDIQIMAPLSEGDAIRNVIGAPGGFVERAPFARQWGASLWTFTSVEQAQEAPDGAQPGYALEDAALVSTPLTALARVLSDLQTSDLSDASHHVSRLDLLQEAYDLGLYQPGTWVSAYLDDGGRELDGAEISQRVRFFDNGNRGRSYIAGFDQGADGSYRLASLEVAAPAAEDNRLTPSAPLPTLTFTPVPTDTPVPSPTTPLDPSAQATLDAQPTPTLTFTPTATNTPLPTQTDTPTPTATSLPTQTPTNTPTTTPTFTATPSPTQTSTATPTFTDTPTPTETATPTATERPYPVPEIPTEQAPLAKGTVVRWPANLRAEPNTGSATIVQLGAAIPVDLFGITEDGTWMLVRVNSPEDERNGEIGWIATDLMEIAGSTAFLTRYRVDGTPVVPPTPTYTPTLGTPTATHTVAPTETPTPTLSPTPRPTPVIAAAEAEPMAEIVAPPPEAGEYLLTIRTDEQEIADVSAIGAVDAEQRDWTVLGGTADIQIWSGLFGAFPPEWVSAPASLLGPGATLYVQGVPSADNGSVLSAQRVRIAAAPATQRARLVARPELAGSVADGSAVALMGSREEAGVYLLETAGTLRQLWIDEREAAWAGGDPSAGVIISGGNPQIAASEFTWIRGDGLGLQVFAQPYHDLHGVVSDALGGLWWIETPQADMDQWQLWQYDAEQGRIVLRLRASGSVFQNGNSTTGSPLTPILLFAQPQLGEGGQIASVSLIVDTLDGAAQQQYQGVFRAEVKLEPGPESEVVGTPQLLMTPGGYRGPLQISPDGSKLAHFLYDPEHPSLTSGVIRPANTARVLILEGRGANTIRTVYQTENRFEFLAPNLGWQGAEKLVLARSRFAPGDTFGIDPFGIVRVTLPDAERPSDQIQTSSYLFPDQNQLRDFAVCADGLHTLTISSNGSGVLELARWNGVDAPQPLFVLPETMSRSFVCWQAPDELIAAP